MARRVPVAENNGGSSPAAAAKSEPGPPGVGVAVGLPPAKARASANTTTASVTPTKSPGILPPPPDVRCIVDKTAEFVAQNGLEFEQKILSNEKRNPTFNFLKSKDAYHSYYQQRILEFIDKGQSPVKPVTPSDNSESK